VTHGSWVTWVMGQELNGSLGSWVTLSDPFPALIGTQPFSVISTSLRCLVICCSLHRHVRRRPRHFCQCSCDIANHFLYWVIHAHGFSVTFIKWRISLYCGCGELLYYPISQHAEFTGSRHLLWPNKFCLNDTYPAKQSHQLRSLCPHSMVSPGYASVLLDSLLLPQLAFCTHCLIPLLYPPCSSYEDYVL